MDRPWRTYALLFAVGLLVYGGFAGTRLKAASKDRHFALQADAWLKGQLSIRSWPRTADDPAVVETVELTDGQRVRGRRLATRAMFQVAGGDEISTDQIRRTVDREYYVSFPPFPALLILPQALVSGADANDVILTVLAAAAILPLAFGAFRRLAGAGLSERSVGDDLWLTAALSFGTVLFFSAVQGRVWYTAHTVAVALALIYFLASIEARHPILAGFSLAFAATTRVPMAFMVPLFLFEAWRMSDRDVRRFAPLALRFAVPVAVVAIAAGAVNVARFDDPLEFGHRYLNIRQQHDIETTGMFSPRYLGRNLGAAGLLVPTFSASAPFVKVSGHGLAIWFSTPVLLLLAVGRWRGGLARVVAATALIVALPTLLYHNTGWLQFGYRFSLDYLVLLFALLAMSRRPLGPIAKGLILFGIAVNTFGAVTFGRLWQFYSAGDPTRLFGG